MENKTLTKKAIILRKKLLHYRLKVVRDGLSRMERAMTKHPELKRLEKIERKAWNTKMRGSEADACTICGKKGKNELAWRKAADDCHSYREKHGLLGLTWKQIEAMQ